MADTEHLLNMKQVQEIFGCSRAFAYKIVNQPDFPKIRINSKILVPATKLQKWIDSYTGKEYELL